VSLIPRRLGVHQRAQRQIEVIAAGLLLHRPGLTLHPPHDRDVPLPGDLHVEAPIAAQFPVDRGGVEVVDPARPRQAVHAAQQVLRDEVNRPAVVDEVVERREAAGRYVQVDPPPAPRQVQ
jgi:hypothetical protein